jgi:hypothetical protein
MKRLVHAVALIALLFVMATIAGSQAIAGFLMRCFRGAVRDGA